VKVITCDTATQFGFHDRGLLREGMAADIVVFDPATVGPRMPEVVCDLPAGATRLRQKADGMRATIVNGMCCCATTSRPATCRASSCAGALGTG
jgi:N-acyl-D-amino-acid deacylase